MRPNPIPYMLSTLFLACMAFLAFGCASTNLGDRIYADAECMRALSESGIMVYMSTQNPGQKDHPTAIDIANTVLMNETPEKVLTACKDTLNAIGQDVQKVKAQKKGGPA